MKIDVDLFWERFDLLLKEKFTDIGEFCDATKLSYNTVISQRARKSVPKIEQLLDMTSVLGVPLDFLVTGADPKPAPKIMTTFTESKTLMSIAHALAVADQRQIDAVQLILGIPPQEESSKVLA